MKSLKVGVFGLAVSFGGSLVLASDDAWKTCDGCSWAEKHQCASEVALEHQLKTGDFAWIYDFHSEIASKFYVQVTPPGTIIQGADGADGSSDTSSLPSVTVIQSPLGGDEAYYAGLLNFFVNDVWRPQGGAYDYPSCQAQWISGEGQREASEGEISGRRSSGMMVHPINIPPATGQNTAYDVFGALAAASQLAEGNVGLLGLLGEVQNIFDGWVPASPINVNTQLKLQFSDGSYGIWKFNFQSDQWEPDWSTFRDSEGNPMPLTPGDMVGQRYDFSGTPIGQNSLREFLDRARVLGIPITGPGGGQGGDSVPTRCRMEGDTMRCWPIGPY